MITLDIFDSGPNRKLNEAVGLDRSKVPNYPNDPATIQHRIDTAKAILSDPKSDPDSRRAAAAILAQHKGVAEGSETAADIDKQIEFHKQGQAAAQYKGSMNKMHAAKIRELEAKKKQQGVAEGTENLSIGQQMARDGITYSPEKENELIGLMAQYMKKAGMSSKAIRYYLSYDEDFIPDQLSDLPRQDVAEAGNKPLEKSYIGTGDTRTPRELKNQMQGASDEFVRSVADKKTGPFHSKVAKMQGKLAKSELRRREQGVAENSMADFFAKAAQEKFPTATIRKNGQTIQEPPKRDVPKQQVDVAKLKQQYAELKKKYDQLGGDSWQYADRMMDRDIEAQKVYQQLNNLARWISNADKDNVKEQGRDTDLFGRSEPSFDDEYVKPATASKKSKASSWADPASSDYVGRREVARRQAAQPAQPAKVAEPQWSPATGAYSTQAAKQQRPTTPMTATPSGNGKKLTPQEYIRRIGIDEGRMSEIYAEYQDYKKLSPREFYDMYKLTKQQWLEKHRGLIQQSKLPVEEDNGVKFAAEVGSKALGNANMGLLIKAYHARTPRITLHFGDKSIDLDNEDIEAIARYYDETLTDPNDRWNFIYQTMSRADKLTALLAKIGRRSEKAVQQPGLFQEANKKKDDEEGVGKVHDVALQRAISKSKAAFPTAQSGIQALMKSFAQDQERDQDEFEKVRRADRRQDQLLAQISQVDKDQEKELQDLDNQNNTLAQRLQQLQSVNSKLEKQLAAMSGRKPKDTEKKAEPKAEPKAADININVPKTEPIAKAEPKTEPKAEPNVSYTFKPTSKKVEPKSAKNKKQDVMKATSKELSKNQGPMAAMTQRIKHGDQSITDKITGQQALDFDNTNDPYAHILHPSIPRRLTRLNKDPANIIDVTPKQRARNAADLSKQNISNISSPTDAPVDTDILRKAAYDVGMSENQKQDQEADYGDEYQDMVARVGQKAKQQEKDKPVDIADLARRLAAIEASRKD